MFGCVFGPCFPLIMAAADPHIVALTDILSRIVSLQESSSNSSRPKNILSHTFKIGDSWPDFSEHFVSSFKSAYGFTDAETDDLHAACLLWLPSKLQEETTLTTFQDLPDDAKRTWPALNDALTIAFTNDIEKEIFLGDIASFRRQGRNLLQFKTELLRLMSTHQSELRDVESEFERQSTMRFIEGLDDEKLKQKLRFHCRKERNNLQAAYEFAVNWEAAEAQMRAAEEKGNSFAVITDPTAETTDNGNAYAEEAEFISESSSSSANTAVLSSLYRDLHHIELRHEITHQQVEELEQEHGRTNDCINRLSRDITELSDQMSTLEETIDLRFDIFEGMLMNQGAEQEYFDVCTVPYH